MAKILFQLVVLAALSALNTFATVQIFTNTHIDFSVVSFSVGLIILSFVGMAFSIFTATDTKIENLKIKVRLAKAELSPMKEIVQMMKKRDEEKREFQVFHHTSNTFNPGAEIKIDTDTKEEKTGIVMEEINPRTGKPYKLSFEKRMILKEKALAREQEKRTKKRTKKRA